MKFRSVGGACKMFSWSRLAPMLLLGCAVGSRLDDNRCDKIYSHRCGSGLESAVTEYRGVKSQRCSVDDISNEIVFSILLSEDEQSSSGMVLVNLWLPNVECRYQVALLVNSLITNREDCTNGAFHRTNAYRNEVHTTEMSVCVAASANDSAASNCQNQSLSLGYKHVFTGCYALRFTIDGYKYSVRGSTFLDTNYTRTEVAEPDVRCRYEDQVDPEISEEQVRFALRISVLASVERMRFTFVPMSQHPRDTKGNTCVQYSKNPSHTWEIDTLDPKSAVRNCSRLGTETETRNLECNLMLHERPRDGYCLQIVLVDTRCHRQSVWNPPPDGAGGKPPCTWIQSCARIVKNTSAIVEYNGLLQGTEQSGSNHALLLPIIATVILIVLIVIGTILFAYRSRSRHVGQRVYVNTNMRNLKISRYPSEVESVETTDDETARGGSGDDCDAIVLLYARGSPTFMSLMSDFREILKNHCGCHVHDWYAASEWDAVARVGPSAWVADLLKQKHRALWIDTPKARSLIEMQWKSNRSTELKRSYERCLDEEAISDFRDVALPSVLDLAKKNVTPEPALQYSRHFVLRLEGFDSAANKTEDPFEDLSPHTRYLIPHHLGALCSHISSWRTNVDAQSLKTEESQFRERLIRMKTNNS